MNSNDINQQQKLQVGQIMLAALKVKHNVFKMKQQEQEEEENDKFAEIQKKTPWKDPQKAYKKTQSLTGNIAANSGKLSQFQKYNQPNEQNLIQDSLVNNELLTEEEQQGEMIDSIANHFSNIIQGITNVMDVQIQSRIDQNMNNLYNVLKLNDRNYNHNQKKNYYQSMKNTQFIRFQDNYNNHQSNNSYSQNNKKSVSNEQISDTLSNKNQYEEQNYHFANKQTIPTKNINQNNRNQNIINRNDYYQQNLNKSVSQKSERLSYETEGGMKNQNNQQNLSQNNNFKTNNEYLQNQKKKSLSQQSEHLSYETDREQNQPIAVQTQKQQTPKQVSNYKYSDEFDDLNSNGFDDDDTNNYFGSINKDKQQEQKNQQTQQIESRYNNNNNNYKEKINNTKKEESIDNYADDFDDLEDELNDYNPSFANIKQTNNSAQQKDFYNGSKKEVDNQKMVKKDIQVQDSYESDFEEDVLEIL